MTMPAQLGLQGHVARPRYVAMTKDLSFFHSNIMRDVDLPPFDSLKGTPNLSMHQPIEIGSFANLSDIDPPL